MSKEPKINWQKKYALPLWALVAIFCAAFLLGAYVL